ncbi:MAG: hypothetical protein LBF40_01755 [Deltaproteobacteria bacterium]|jgi:nucleoside phosphorylase|nr:hypothetical protein [Deltaproteobacteria bacterium]
MSAKTTVMVIAPTPAEYLGVRRLEKLKTEHLLIHVLESGPGKINAAMKAAEGIQDLKPGCPSLIIAGVGTSGSLSLAPKAGDVVASVETVIADWMHEDGKESLVGPYGVFDYARPDNDRVRRMLIREEDPLLTGFVGGLGKHGFLEGRILTSDCFVSGKEHKLALGGTYGAMVCDMESGAFAYTAKRRGVRFFNLRIVADTLDETLENYFEKESDVTARLGDKAAEAMGVLDRLLGQSQ